MRRIGGLLVLLVAMVVGCSEPSGVDSPGVELSVFAASSLTEVFRDLESHFEHTHPGVDVKLTFAGSQVLRLQIEQGATADVFASANQSHLQALVDSGYVTDSKVFAHNELVVVVPRSNPAGIESFDELDNASRIVVGTSNVPVGTYTRRMLDRARPALGDAFVAGVQQRIVSEETNVRLVRAKVEMGEADAAVVYRTDAASSDRLRVVPIPEALNAPVSYPIGATVRGEHSLEAEQFVTFVLSAKGREILRRRGFLVESQ